MSTTSPSTRQPVLAPAEESARRKLIGRVGNWQLVRLLAETKFTRIYVARPTDTEEGQSAQYAVKMLRKEWWRDSSAIEIFRREAWVGGKVSHPHVVPVLSANLRQPPFHLAMPLLPGSTLRERLDSGWQPSLSEALWIARQVAEGLQAIAKTVGMVHGDVKPGNVQIDPTGHATLLDLGFARSSEESTNWANRAIVGSLRYLAPELATSAYVHGPASDLYSLGVMLFEMLTGAPPFTSEDAAELITCHREQTPPLVSDLRDDIPRDVAELIHLLLSKDPLRRADSLAEVIGDLIRLEIDSFPTHDELHQLPVPAAGS